MKKPTTKMYLVWNLTNYGQGFEHLGLYNTMADAEEAYNKEMKKRYGVSLNSQADEESLLDVWNDSESGCVDSWRIDEIIIKD